MYTRGVKYDCDMCDTKFPIGPEKSRKVVVAEGGGSVDVLLGVQVHIPLIITSHSSSSTSSYSFDHNQHTDDDYI